MHPFRCLCILLDSIFSRDDDWELLLCCGCCSLSKNKKTWHVKKKILNEAKMKFEYKHINMHTRCCCVLWFDSEKFSFHLFIVLKVGVEKSENFFPQEWKLRKLQISFWTNFLGIESRRSPHTRLNGPTFQSIKSSRLCGVENIFFNVATWSLFERVKKRSRLCK